MTNEKSLIRGKVLKDYVRKRYARQSSKRFEEALNERVKQLIDISVDRCIKMKRRRLSNLHL